MKAVVYDRFGETPVLREVPDPAVPDTGVVVRVAATGICRSDWHGWMGNDPDVKVPHVPGHEFAGTIEAVGPGVAGWSPGDRVTLPFVCGCGTCVPCLSGDPQVCDRQFQPGFTHWGSFAERVAVHYAEINLVRLPDAMNFTTAATLGCRFATAFRAVVDQGRVAPGAWVAVHGCGGVGLSAIMIAAAQGARVVAVDIDAARLESATRVGAETVVKGSDPTLVVDAVMEATGGGAHLSLDALGDPAVCANAISSLRKRGRHVQVGILEKGAEAVIPMDRVIGRELEILGSHGMAARRYPVMLEMIATGQLDPGRLVGRRISLEEAPAVLAAMDSFAGTGMTVIDRL